MASAYAFVGSLCIDRYIVVLPHVLLLLCVCVDVVTGFTLGVYYD